MWPFKKKEETKPVQAPSKKPCEHKYKDFDWYARAEYDIDTHEFVARIYEPYVCIHCGHRKDIVLDEISSPIYTIKEARERYAQFQEPYLDKLKDRAYVEDKIHDMILVDRSYIDIYMALHNPVDKKIRGV